VFISHDLSAVEYLCRRVPADGPGRAFSRMVRRARSSRCYGDRCSAAGECRGACSSERCACSDRATKTLKRASVAQPRATNLHQGLTERQIIGRIPTTEPSAPRVWAPASSGRGECANRVARPDGHHSEGCGCAPRSAWVFPVGRAASWAPAAGFFVEVRRSPPRSIEERCRRDLRGVSCPCF
jgi:hypothetical protein